MESYPVCFAQKMRNDEADMTNCPISKARQDYHNSRFISFVNSICDLNVFFFSSFQIQEEEELDDHTKFPLDNSILFVGDKVVDPLVNTNQSTKPNTDTHMCVYVYVILPVWF